MMIRVRGALIAAGLCATVPFAVAPSAGAVSLVATSPIVNQPGDVGQVCVLLSSAGAQVAGTQNDLVWDGNCATLPEPPPCAEAGGHGKQLQKVISRTDSFTFRGIILSFSDTDPIPDGPLYCCQFTIDAAPGECCSLRVTNAAASDPNGKAIPASGNQVGLCVRGDQNQAVGSIGGGGFNQPLSASNAPAEGGAGAAQPAPAAPAPAGGGPAAAPAAQVLQGGGAAPGAASGGGGAVVPQPGVPIAPAATMPAATLPAAVPPTAVAPPLPPPTAPATVAAAAPTQGRTAPAAADTPTPRRTVAVPATRVATPAAAAKAQQAAPAVEQKGGGWFGCQIGAGASAAPVLGIGAVAMLAVVWRRRRAARRG